VGDQARLVSGRMEIGEELVRSYRSCTRELHVCTQESYLLEVLGRVRQLFSELKHLPNLFLYTKNDAVAKAGFACRLQAL